MEGGENKYRAENAAFELVQESQRDFIALFPALSQSLNNEEHPHVLTCCCRWRALAKTHWHRRVTTAAFEVAVTIAAEGGGGKGSGGSCREGCDPDVDGCGKARISALVHTSTNGNVGMTMMKAVLLTVHKGSHGYGCGGNNAGDDRAGYGKGGDGSDCASL
ncbi:Protein of unknown function [Gryllus bimaculatus]|nr:Protein of unknown function [Gryllus bimaculatus]